MFGYFYGIRYKKPHQKLIFNGLAGFFSGNNSLAFPSQWMLSIEMMTKRQSPTSNLPPIGFGKKFHQQLKYR
jgi:hypothetical protein